MYFHNVKLSTHTEFLFWAKVNLFVFPSLVKKKKKKNFVQRFFWFSKLLARLGQDNKTKSASAICNLQHVHVLFPGHALHEKGLQGKKATVHWSAPRNEEQVLSRG